MLNELFEGKSENILGFFHPMSTIVDPRDVAAIHVAGLLSADTNGQRLWGSGAPLHSVNELYAIWREAYPDRHFPEDIVDGEPPNITIAKEASTKLLREFEGRSWLPIKESILANVAAVA